VAREQVRAFAPGRVNLIGEHTDYNGGLALPFAIAEGILVRARTREDGRVDAHALDLDEHDEFTVGEPGRTKGWRAFVRGMVAELHRAGFEITGASLEIGGDLARGAGLSSSAALEVALGLALLGLGDADATGHRQPDHRALDRTKLARLCSRVESEWAGARTGTLDQLASLYGQAHAALLIDFASFQIEPVPLELHDGWRLVVLDSGESHDLAQSGYNERRSECAAACALLGVELLSEAHADDLARLPPTLARRAVHVLGENERVRMTVAALARNDLPGVGVQLDDSHASLRDYYECSTAAVERTVLRLKSAGAVGARMVGGGFGGHVLGLLPPDAAIPPDAHAVAPSRGAHLVS
jgi:galactokinase